MDIKMELNLPLQELTGNQESIIVNGNIVIQCLDDLIGKYPDAKKLLFNKNGSFDTHASN